MSLKELKPKDVEFVLLIDTEKEHIRNNVPGAEDNARLYQRVKNRLATGDVWAWMHYTVKAKWNNLQGTAFIGCCSEFRNEEDFRVSKTHKDLKAEALADLNKVVNKTFDNLQELVENKDES